MCVCSPSAMSGAGVTLQINTTSSTHRHTRAQKLRQSSLTVVKLTQIVVCAVKALM